MVVDRLQAPVHEPSARTERSRLSFWKGRYHPYAKHVQAGSVLVVYNHNIRNMGQSANGFQVAAGRIQRSGVCQHQSLPDSRVPEEETASSVAGASGAGSDAA